jgi:NitT/TauT family transport system substrate-binding protein
MFASRVLAANGIDPSDPKNIVWKQFPPQEQGLALEKGEIDAVATSEPIGTMLLKGDKVRNIVDQAVDAPYKDEYCCAVVVSGKFASRDPDAAAKVTRAILKAAKWVQVNPTAAAVLSVEKKHLASNPELNALALSKLTYVPSVSGGQAAVSLMGDEMKKAKFLGPSVDVAELSRRAFLKLDGVSDQWVETLAVERVAGGGPAPEADGARWAALVAQGGMKSCCVAKQN